MEPKSCLQGMETSHARIPGKPLWVNTETNGSGYHSPGWLFEILSNLYLHFQSYLVNKWTLTQGVEILFSKVVHTHTHTRARALGQILDERIRSFVAAWNGMFLSYIKCHIQNEKLLRQSWCCPLQIMLTYPSAKCFISHFTKKWLLLQY